MLQTQQDFVIGIKLIIICIGLGTVGYKIEKQ